MLSVYITHNLVVASLTSCDWKSHILFFPSSSIYSQVSLGVKEKEEIQVSQGLLEWREHQDFQASLEAQGRQDPLDLLDQEQERESQEFQDERVDCSCYLLKRGKLFLTPADCLTVSVIRGERIWGAERFPWTARPPWIPRISRRKRRSWRPWKKWILWWCRIPGTERLSINHCTNNHDYSLNNCYHKIVVWTLELHLFCRWKRIPWPPWLAFSSISIRVCWQRRTWNSWRQCPSWFPWTQRYHYILTP